MSGPLLFPVVSHACRINGFAPMPVNWPVHAKDFLSDDPKKKVLPISGDFEEWRGTPWQVRSMSEALDVRGARSRPGPGSDEH